MGETSIHHDFEIPNEPLGIISWHEWRSVWRNGELLIFATQLIAWLFIVLRPAQEYFT
jgi:hypothetical protein